MIDKTNEGINKIKGKLKIKILYTLLQYNKLRVGDILLIVGGTQSAVSQCLLDMYADGLLDRMQVTAYRWYSIKTSKKKLIKEVFNLLDII